MMKHAVLSYLRKYREVTPAYLMLQNSIWRFKKKWFFKITSNYYFQLLSTDKNQHIHLKSIQKNIRP